MKRKSAPRKKSGKRYAVGESWEMDYYGPHDVRSPVDKSNGQYVSVDNRSDFGHAGNVRSRTEQQPRT